MKRIMHGLKKQFCLLPFFVLMVLGIAYGQPLESDFQLIRYNLPRINPATTNYANLMDPNKNSLLNASQRIQWGKFSKDDRAPIYSSLRFEQIIEGSGSSKLKLGLMYREGEAGYITDQSLFGNIGSIIDISNSAIPTVGNYISVGLNVGVENYRVNLNNVNWVDPSNAEDLESFNDLHFDVALGVFWHKFDRSTNANIFRSAYAGISTPQIFLDSLHNANVRSNVIDRTFPLYLLGGTRLLFYEEWDVFIEPSVLVKWIFSQENSSFSNVNLNCRFIYDKDGKISVWLGGGYATNVVGMDLMFFQAEGGVRMPFGQELEGDRGLVVFIAGGIDFDLGTVETFGNSIEFSLGVGW